MTEVFIPERKSKIYCEINENDIRLNLHEAGYSIWKTLPVHSPIIPA